MAAGILVSALLAGLLSFFSPCVLPLIPVYVGMLAGDATAAVQGVSGRANRLRLLANALAFVLGISFVFVALGIGAGLLGSLLNNAYLTCALGLVVFVFGLQTAGIIHIPLLDRQLKAEVTGPRKGRVATSFLLGLAFSFGWTPCVGPILGTILALAADQGSVAASAGLLLVYSLGLCVPFLVIALASDLLLKRVRKLNRFLPAIQRAGGVLIAVMGLWMVFSQVGALLSANRTGVTDVNLTEVKAGDADLSGVSSAWKNVVLTDLAGEKHRLSDLKGTPVYLEFWGSWCSSCVQDLDQMQEVWREHEQAGDVFVTSVVTPGFYGERSVDEFVAWAEQEGIEAPVYMDTNGSLSAYLGVAAFPTSVLINSDGTIDRIRVGAIGRDELEQLLAELQ